MIRRSLTVGVLAGLLLSLASLYPAISLLTPTLLPNWEPVAGDLWHGVLLMLSAGVGLPTLLGFGFVAAQRAGARGLRDGLWSGTIAGAFAGYIYYVTLVSPLNALHAMGLVAPYFPPTPANPLPPDEVVVSLVRVLGNGIVQVELVVLVAVAIAALQGMLVGWQRRNVVVPPRPGLFQLLRAGQHPRQWFAGDESPLWVGMVVGVVISILLTPTVFGQFYVDLVQDWPELAALMRRSMMGNMMPGAVTQSLPFISPLVNLTLIGFGALVVGFLRNPSSRFGARVRSVVLAAVIIFISWFASIARIIYLYVALVPFQTYRLGELGTGIISPALIESGRFYVATVFAFAWGFLVIAVLVGVVLGVLQGVGYGVVVPLLRPRPVDVAARLWRRVQRTPAELVSALYELFTHNREAYDVLAHLAVSAYRTQPDVARLAAAYHTLATSRNSEDHVATSVAIQEILAGHPEWRWADDIGRVYATFHDVLTARTLEQIVTIDEPPQQHTATLPPLMAQSVRLVGRIVAELHKLTLVDDLPTHLIFLENALEAIHDAQRFVNMEMAQGHMPEAAALGHVLDHWQGIVLKAIKQLKGRADVVCALQTKQSSPTGRVLLLFEVTNKGLNVAQKVQLSLRPGSDYLLEESHDQVIEILPPAETRQVSLAVRPVNNARRLRIAWQVSYDDAVDAERRLDFADVVEFVAPDKPFQRIFPIPYVTGTPLKTDDVFVGRQDVFDFIRENLLGTHQNNVIILHGQRRTGKTSVLYRLGHVMSGTHYGVLIDMQGKPARGEVDFLYSIADDIVFALEDHGVQVPLPPRSDFEESPEFFFRARFLRGLYPALGDKNLLLMFDEFEELQRRVEDGHLQPTIFHFLRNLMQHEERVDFVFSGTHKLEALGAAYWSVLFNIAAYKPITFLSKQEVHRLMEEPIAGYNVEYDPLAMEHIMAMTAGHPYFTQLVLHETMVYHNETARSYLTVADVAQVLERIVERGEAHFKYIWAESTAEERAVLRGLSELLTGPDPAGVAKLRACLVDLGYESDDRWERALQSLVDRDILAAQGSQNLLYRFKVDLIRLWVTRTRPGT